MFRKFKVALEVGRNPMFEPPEEKPVDPALRPGGAFKKITRHEKDSPQRTGRAYRRCRGRRNGPSLAGNMPPLTTRAMRVSISRTREFQDPAVLERAWALPVAAAYRHGGYEYQANSSFCGPASAANVLHSEKVSATQRSVLSGSDIHPIFGLLPMGITLDQEAALLRTSTRQRVAVLRDLSLGEFRAQLPTNQRSFKALHRKFSSRPALWRRTRPIFADFRLPCGQGPRVCRRRQSRLPAICRVE